MARQLARARGDFISFCVVLCARRALCCCLPCSTVHAVGIPRAAPIVILRFHMNAHRFVPAALIALLCGANAALADLPTYAYVTTGPGKQVLKVNNATHATAAIFTANG